MFLRMSAVATANQIQPGFAAHLSVYVQDDRWSFLQSPVRQAPNVGANPENTQ
jgi:hypothetical protein